MVYKLYSYSPSLRDLRVEDLTVITIYVMDHWYVMAGGIWQVSWFPTEGRYVLYNICASNIELVEIQELLWTQEEEYIEMAKLYAQNCLEFEQFRKRMAAIRVDLAPSSRIPHLHRTTPRGDERAIGRRGDRQSWCPPPYRRNQNLPGLPVRGYDNDH